MHIGMFYRTGVGLDQRRGTLAREEQGSWWKDRKLPAADLLGGEENRSSGGMGGQRIVTSDPVQVEEEDKKLLEEVDREAIDSNLTTMMMINEW